MFAVMNVLWENQRAVGKKKVQKTNIKTKKAFPRALLLLPGDGGQPLVRENGAPRGELILPKLRTQLPPR